MMSLLSVTVKKARYVGAQASQFNTYVTLKLQNVKSTTVTVKGATPCWEQDFLFETNDLNTGLLIEVWSKGMIWDRAMGYHWIPLQTVQYSNEEGSGQWLSLEAELVMRDGEVVGTKSPTGHSLLVDCRFELPFDPENIEASDLQRKLEMLNNIMDQEARMEQARRQMQYFGHSGYSEDSDYTSDLNYPVGQHANSSASQFRSAAHQIHTPQRSLETSRENSYERDDAPPQHPYHLPPPAIAHQQHLSPGSHRRHHHQKYSQVNDDYNYSTPNARQYQDNNADFDPLFYNSRPRNKPDYSSQEMWASCETSIYNQSVDSVDMGFSVDTQYYNNQPSKSKARRPSLERQSTLYDDSTLYCDSIYYPNDNVTQINCVEVSSQHFNQNQSCDEYYDTLSYPFQDEEDRQWDSGGYPTMPPHKSNSKKLPSIPVVQNYMNKRRSSHALDDFYDEPYRSTPTPRRKMPQIPTKRSTSRQSSFTENSSHRGASLPPTPTKTPKILPKVTNHKPFNSLPPTPGRQLPKPNVNHRSAKTRRNSVLKRTSSAEYNEPDYDYYLRPGATSAKEMYNEDYNYAYQSNDNLHHEEMKNDGFYYEDSEFYNGNERRKLGMSPLQQQNTDSLESRDDELKDSFETAVSSMNSSLNQLKKTADCMAPTTTPTTAVIPTQYTRDQSPPPKAIAPPSYKPSTRLVRQQESLDHPPSEDFLEKQESVESYVEDEPESSDFPSKAINHDSPSSVIHVEDDTSLRRGSSQITVVDPYHPGLEYASRRPSDPRRVSPPEHKNIPEVSVEDEQPEKKSVSFEEEEEEQAKPRPQVTAQQRWLWAYNKIIMQLNMLNDDEPQVFAMTLTVFRGWGARATDLHDALLHQTPKHI